MPFVGPRWYGWFGAAVLLAAARTPAAEYPAPRDGVWVAPDFRFHTGETVPGLRVHYSTVGAPTGQPVVVLHGTGGSAASLLTPAFAGELFGPGQPLDASRYFIILPDAIGHGGSSKPSDGLRTRFPRYDYEDMVRAQYRLVTEGLGIRHARLVMGFSMGGMQTWIWGARHPDFMDALVPMASQPTAMGGRNWMMRRLIIDSIRRDPDWKGGDYTTQPGSAHFASVFYGIAASGGTLAYQRVAPTREQADRMIDARLAAPFRADANDVLYQWESSGDFDPSSELERIEAPLLAINSADDERNPPETGVMERALARVRNGRLYLIPASERTTGHGTVTQAALYADVLREFLRAAPPRAAKAAAPPP